MMQCLSPLRSLRLRRLTSLHCGNLKALSKAARLGTASKNEKEPPTQPVTSLPATVDNASGTPAEKRLEKFIPLTRRALLRMLMDEKDFLKTAEKQLMEGVAASLDAKYSKRFYSILEHCKSLYDGIDPDKDTLQTRVLSKKQVLDSEYNLLQMVENLLDKANFIEIPREKLLTLLHDRDTSGIIVSVNPSEYEQLRVWTRGFEPRRKSLYVRLKGFLWSLLRPQEKQSSTFTIYTRVFLAVRTKGEKTLHLKFFKDISTNDLEHLLPKGEIKMSSFDKTTLVSGVVLGACLPFLRGMPVLSDQWMLGGVGLAAFMAGRAWIGYKNKRNQYLARLATTLYYKTVANNRGVLTLLTDRAQDEEFKEALLVYTFLLSPVINRSVNLPVHDTEDSLKKRIELWLEKHCQLKGFSFDISDALGKLDDLGLLVRRRNGTLTALSVPEALSVLPSPSERWLAVGGRRDSQSMDEHIGDGEGTRRKVPGWS